MKKKLIVERTAHYHIQEGEKPKEVLYILHGYAQLASDFLQEFEDLKTYKLVVVAAEAISKFYNKERKTVASWMTSHEREDEIVDYVNYLNQLHKKISSEYKADSYSILGFSQGTSTALRWMKGTAVNFKNAYICSGSIPPELKKGDLDQHKKCTFYYFYGDDDRFMSLEKGESLAEQLQILVPHVKKMPFQGKHQISNECIQQIVKNLS